MKRLIFFLFASWIFNVSAQVPFYVPSSGLLAWYPFSGNANDAGPFGHNGTVYGATPTTDRFGNSASAYAFNGISNYISIPDNSNFRPQNFTISSWVLFSTNPSNLQVFIAKNVAVSTYETLVMFYTNSWRSNVGGLTGIAPPVIYNQSASAGNWYHYVYQYDAANSVQKIYLNGSLAATSAVSYSVVYNSQPWTIGMEVENGVNDFFFNGKADDIGIWNRILSPCEVLQLYLANGPVSGVSASSNPVCAGQTTTLTASGASSYTWFPGNIVTSQSLAVTPGASTTYTVLSSLSPTCQSSATLALQTVPLPTLTVSSSSWIPCVNNSATLTASGASTYSWNTQATSAQIVVTPSVAGIGMYTVSGTDSNGCTNTATLALQIAPLPTITVSSSSWTLCVNTSATLTASGAGTYSWNTQATSAQIVVTPTVAGIGMYTVSGTDSNGCTNTATLALPAAPLPTLMVSSSSRTLCVNTSATLTASGASTYSWNTQGMNAQIVVTPTVAGLKTYTVSGTDANGCVNTATISQMAELCTDIRYQSAQEATLQIYPNPNNGRFNIEATENGFIVIINALGEIVYSQTLTEKIKSVDIGHLNNGIYFVKAVNGNNRRTIRLVKE